MSEERNNLNQDELEQTRRGLFIQELLDSGKKSGDLLDAQTMKLPVIHNPEAQRQTPADPEATAKFTPIRGETVYGAEPETDPDAELDAFFSDGAALDPIEELARRRREPEHIEDFMRARRTRMTTCCGRWAAAC